MSEYNSIGLIEIPDVRSSFWYGFQPFMPRVPKPGDFPKFSFALPVDRRPRTLTG